jgi:hypothetical protein
MTVVIKEEVQYLHAFNLAHFSPRLAIVKLI